MLDFFILLPKFLYYKFHDLKDHFKNGRKFDLYGLRLITGRQGSGKSTILAYTLRMYQKRFPKCKVYTNFGYAHQDGEFNHWKQLFDPAFLNGEDGVIIGWDEIQNDFASTDFKNIPDGFLLQITQQRKQRVCILATSQVYSRVLKALREQAFLVGECRTYFKRWTRVKYFDAFDYDLYYESKDPRAKMKMFTHGKLSFIQDDNIRNLFDSYQVIKSMTSKEYIHPLERNKDVIKLA